MSKNNKQVLWQLVAVSFIFISLNLLLLQNNDIMHTSSIILTDYSLYKNLEFNRLIILTLLSFSGLFLIFSICQIQRREYEQAKKENKISQFNTLLESEIYLYFRNSLIDPSIKITEEHWIALESTMNANYASFFHILSTLSPFSIFEKRVNILLKLQFSASEIAAITNHSKQAISLVRKRMYNKCMRKEGSPADWDRFIDSI